MVNILYMASDKDDVSRERITLIACGKNEIVVQNAAQNPNISIPLIIMPTSIVGDEYGLTIVRYSAGRYVRFYQLYGQNYHFNS